MSNDSLTPDEVRDEIHLTIDDIAPRGAQRMLADDHGRAALALAQWLTPGRPGSCRGEVSDSLTRMLADKVADSVLDLPMDAAPAQLAIHDI